MSVQNSKEKLESSLVRQEFSLKFLSYFNEKKKLKSVGGLGSILIIFLLVLFVNHSNILRDDIRVIVTEDQTRQIASTKSSDLNEFNSQWKKKIATQISETSDIPSAKPSRQPNPLEKLVFGELKGYYLLHMEGVKVREMRLDNKYQASEAPQYLGEEFSFLNTHRDLWWVGFNSLSLKDRNDQSSVVVLLDSTKKIVGEANFTWDNGRLISLKIDKK